jgi:hypothetical protein
MFDQTLNIEEELAEIPSEYQDIFRQTLEQELSESEQNQTDTEALTYLRRRRDDFKNGSFIRPDGRPGLVTLNPEAVYEQAMPEIVKDTLGGTGNPAERRRTLIKVGLLVGVALVFLFFVFRGRSQEGDGQGSQTAVAAQTGEGLSPGATGVPTPPLPEITGAEESLQTIGGLGGALTIGRPSAIEIHYRGTEETIALAIDPSRPTPRGELRFNEVVMRSENPVAVWLFGTVLNYAVGIPDSMVRNLEPGDSITLSTDTGAALRFIVTETQQGANYEAGRLLSQNRLGLTLFALPAVGEEEVAYAFANYDVTSEENQTAATFEPGEPVLLGGELVVNDVAYSHTATGILRIVVSGTIGSLDVGQSILLSLNAGGDQTAAVEVTPDENGAWQADFTLPAGGVGAALLAEFRSLPDGELVVVRLGEGADLIEQLQVDVTGAWWEWDAGLATIAISIHNPGEGAVFLDPDFIHFPGGDAYEGRWQATPGLPFLIGPGETTGITISFLPQTVSVQIQIGAGLWEVTGLPSPTTVRQPVNGGD